METQPQNQTVSTLPHLEWGYFDLTSARHPDHEAFRNAKEAWGCRAIWQPRKTTRVDFVFNRISGWPHYQREVFWMDEDLMDSLMEQIQEKVEESYADDCLHPKFEMEISFEHEGVRVFANTNGSCGYLYVTAFK